MVSTRNGSFGAPEHVRGAQTRRRTPTGALAGGLAAASLLGAALVGMTGPALTSASASPLARPSAKAAATVSVARRGSLGEVLVGPKGTLYHDNLDKRHKLACTGSCLSLWPPLELAKGAKLSPGRGVSHLGLVARPGGKRQVTFDGEPLYYYSGDTRPDQVNGEGLLGHWYVVHPTTKASATAAHHRARSGTSGTKGGGSWG